MSEPPLNVQIRTTGQEFTLFLDDKALTRPFASKDELHAEFDRLERLLESARITALGSLADKGSFDSPRSVPVTDPRN